MAETIEISQKDARYLALKCQGLTSGAPFGNRSQGVVRAVQQIGYVQIDTISVVQRAHHHVLWSRIPDYRLDMLDRLMNKRRGLFEYWSHAAAILPVSEFRFTLIRKNRLRSGANLWFPKDDKVIQHVLERITNEGPLSARDFKHPERKGRGGWWEWKPSKKALEQLFLDGTLMVKERIGFQKVFDLTERVLPEGVNTETPTIPEFCRWMILKGLTALGPATLIELSYAAPRFKETVSRELAELVEHQKIVRCRIHGQDSKDMYLLPGQLQLLNHRRFQNRIRIINPFDNAIIQRKRLLNLFQFDYKFECYIPAEKRQFGYFCLPLLYRDQFIGLLDCKAHGKEKRLEIKALHTFPGAKKIDFHDLFNRAIEEFARFNGADQIEWP